MKKLAIIISAVGCGAFIFLPVLLIAGQINLRNDVAVAKRHADVVKAADPVASVTYESIRADIQTAQDALDSKVLTNIVASDFSQPQRADIQALKDVLQNLKQATRNAVQACNKLVKKMKQSDLIDGTVK